MSDDGQTALTIIAFVGSVFSPHYARARRRDGVRAVDPLQHCAFNVALYRPSGDLWSMSEHGRGERVVRAAEKLQLGRSTMRYEDGGARLIVDIDERTTHVASPLGQPLRGRVSLELGGGGTSEALVLDAGGAGRHRWWPVAPCARAEVQLDEPGLRFSGSAYHDCNWGDEPLEQGFARWSWSRLALPGGDCAVLYDVVQRDGRRDERAMRFGAGGGVQPIADLERRALPRTRWAVARPTRADGSASSPRVLRTLEDTPFYSRSVIASRVGGEIARGVHESLDLDRFSAGWVQFLLPFRMRRRRA
ncbi:MAG: carotenoid 1,2-hydratase [Myxococcales bacterium]|nr:carotenoid 1,2-hydratase [Myxococcales bacterium]